MAQLITAKKSCYSQSLRMFGTVDIRVELVIQKVPGYISC